MSEILNLVRRNLWQSFFVGVLIGLVLGGALGAFLLWLDRQL